MLLCMGALIIGMIAKQLIDPDRTTLSVSLPLAIFIRLAILKYEQVKVRTTLQYAHFHSTNLAIVVWYGGMCVPLDGRCVLLYLII